jgi:CRP-like cAMP-binding protein
LGELPLTRDLSPADRQVLASSATIRSLKAGDYLWRQGEQLETIYLIESGQVALEISLPRQGPLRIEILHSGDTLGWSSLLESSRCQFDARALTPVRCLAILGEGLHQTMERDPRLGYTLLKRLMPMMTQKLESARIRLFDAHGLDLSRGPNGREAKRQA